VDILRGNRIHRMQRFRRYAGTPKEIHMSIFTVLFVILLIAWILGFGVFHVASAMIHILLVVALISLVLHFIRGPRAA
jgi:Family of unknown function (DUF5670)